jgi:hypothetical protein
MEAAGPVGGGPVGFICPPSPGLHAGGVCGRISRDRHLSWAFP